MSKKKRPSAEEIIRYEKDKKTKIATITFDRPEFLNAPTSDARLRYADVVRAASVDNDVKVVVIRGVGDNLGSGADLPEFMEGNDDPALRLRELKVDHDSAPLAGAPSLFMLSTSSWFTARESSQLATCGSWEAVTARGFPM